MSSNALTNNTLYQRFVAIAQAHPSAIAIEANTTFLNYQTLKKQTEQTAHLLSHHDLQPGDYVGLYLGHSVDFVVTTLACLKQGITFVPLNTEAPSDYVASIIKDANLKAVLTSKHHPMVKQLPVRSINIENRNEFTPLSSDSNSHNETAYLIFTSGSTGSPKGVAITQEALLTLVTQTSPLLSITLGSRIPLFHTLSFDFAIWEFFSTLLTGATLLIPTPNIRKQLSEYFAYIDTSKASTLNMTPSVFYLFTLWLKDHPNAAHHIHNIILGGEALTARHRKAWFNSPSSQYIKLYNLYGITEATIHATWCLVEPSDNEASLIGMPLPHIEAKVVDGDGHEVGTDQVGELWLGGIAITKGYFNQTKLTPCRFPQHRFANTMTSQWFRTGDLVKSLPNGQLAYIGRLDDTVKVRGFRVNCSEVTQLISQIAGIKLVTTIAYYHQSEYRLAAFIVLDDSSLSEKIIRTQLSELLPDYMLPTRIYFEAELPINANGKIDSTVLREKLTTSTTAIKHQGTTDFKSSVISIWSQVLQRNDIDVQSNFFDAGGDSLLLVKLQFALQQHFDRPFSIMDLVKFPSIASFTDHFNRNDS